MREPERRDRPATPFARRAAVVGLVLSHAAVGLTVWGLMKPTRPEPVPDGGRLFWHPPDLWVGRINHFPPVGTGGATYELQLRSRGVPKDSEIPRRPVATAGAVITPVVTQQWEGSSPPQSGRVTLQFLDVNRLTNNHGDDQNSYLLKAVTFLDERCEGNQPAVRLPWSSSYSGAYSPEQLEWDANELLLMNVLSRDEGITTLHSIVLVVTPNP